MAHLLFVDDERDVLNALNRLCRNELGTTHGPLRIATFQSAYGALEFARHQSSPIDVVIADYRMPEMNGVTFLRQMRDLHPHAARLVLSANADRDAVIRAVNEAGILRFLQKPWDGPELVRTIAEVLAEARRNSENHRLADEARVGRGQLTAEEYALRQLEAESPGITRVERSADGGVLLVE